MSAPEVLPGIADVMEMEGAVDCMKGFHAWMPWLQITDRSWVTYCVRCNRQEQWDR